MKYYLLNPLANNGIKADIPGVETIDVTQIDYAAFFEGLNEEDEVVLIGGDGTINYLINHVDTENLKNNVYIWGNGTGNDFLNDIGEKPGREVLLNPYLKNLPTVWINGMKRKFINNMSFGIDGYCCEEADRIKAKKPNKKINYTSIAIKGLLYAFKPRHVWFSVDGTDYEYDNVWLTPTMKGRYCGGGMMLAPGQDRNSDLLTVIVYTCKSKLKSLKCFPLIFEGKHVELTDMTKVITGRKVHVRFSEPCAAQIDGETVLNVTEYTAEL
ncbi:MAG: diacylglycerol kinase family protein [Lachnospiraceae bacterium]|nr:diacylglycerol kinase family protein [Lachnospiraceae bacterium]